MVDYEVIASTWSIETERDPGHKHWSCLKNAADIAGARWYSCALVKFHMHCAVPGKDTYLWRE